MTVQPHSPPSADPGQAPGTRGEHCALYTAFVEENPDAILFVDQAGIITEWNPAAEEIFGYSHSLAIGREAGALIAPSEAPGGGRSELARNLRAGRGRLVGRRTEMTAVRSNGAEFPVELTLTHSMDNGESGFTACVRDITDRLRADAVLNQSEERFRMLVQTVKDYSIHLLDPRGRILTWNAGAELIEGYRPREIIGRYFNRLYTTEDITLGRPEQALLTAGAEGRHSRDGWSVRKDGSLYWASVVLTALRHTDGILFGFSRIGSDRTSSKDAEVEAGRLMAVVEKKLKERTHELQVAKQSLRRAKTR